MKTVTVELSEEEIDFVIDAANWIPNQVKDHVIYPALISKLEAAKQKSSGDLSQPGRPSIE